MLANTCMCVNPGCEYININFKIIDPPGSYRRVSQKEPPGRRVAASWGDE